MTTGYFDMYEVLLDLVHTHKNFSTDGSTGYNQESLDKLLLRANEILMRENPIYAKLVTDFIEGQAPNYKL